MNAMMTTDTYERTSNLNNGRSFSVYKHPPLSNPSPLLSASLSPSLSPLCLQPCLLFIYSSIYLRLRSPLSFSNSTFTPTPYFPKSILCFRSLLIHLSSLLLPLSTLSPLSLFAHLASISQTPLLLAFNLTYFDIHNLFLMGNFAQDATIRRAMKRDTDGFLRSR